METKCPNHRYFELKNGVLICNACGGPPEGAIEDKAATPVGVNYPSEVRRDTRRKMPIIRR